MAEIDLSGFQDFRGGYAVSHDGLEPPIEENDTLSISAYVLVRMVTHFSWTIADAANSFRLVCGFGGSELFDQTFPVGNVTPTNVRFERLVAVPSIKGQTLTAGFVPSSYGINVGPNTMTIVGWRPTIVTLEQLQDLGLESATQEDTQPDPRLIVEG